MKWQGPIVNTNNNVIVITLEYSDNENLKSVVYYSGDFFCCVIDEFNSPFIVSEFMESNCDPLYVTGLGFLDITGTGELYIIKI